MSFDFKLIKGDIKIGADGSPEKVFRYPKLKQDLIKILLTDNGENKYHPSYGSDLGRLDIGTNADQSFVESELSSSAAKAINKLMQLQDFQRKRQYISPQETIIKINSVSVFRDTSDPRMWNVFISVVTAGLDEVNETLTIKLV